MQYSFGTGKLIVMNGISPIELATLQDISMDFDAGAKELYSNMRLPELIALGKGKLSGKATFENVNADALNLLTSGLGTVSTGQYVYAEEAFNMSTGTNTFTPSHAGAFYQNMGVVDVSNSMNQVPMLITGGALSAASTPGVVVSTTGGSIGASTLSVKVAAITTNALSQCSVVGVQQSGLTLPSAGVTAASTGQTTGVLTGTTNSVTVNINPVTNAAGYAIFMGVSGSETLQAITSNISFLLTANVTGGVVFPATDTSGNASSGQYNVNATSGLYSFNTADATNNKSVIVRYLWKDSVNGKTMQLTNQPQGSATYFSMFLSTVMASKISSASYQNNVWLNACLSTKLSLAWKLEDFNGEQFDFSAFSNSSGGLGWMTVGSL